MSEPRSTDATLVAKGSSMFQLNGQHDGERNDDLTREHGTSLRPSSRRGLVGGLIVMLPIVLLAGAWRLGGVSAMGDDLVYYFPIRQYIGEQLRAGVFPLWNPLAGMGMPLAADPQAGLWYPFTYLFAILPALWAYAVSIVIHFALAGGGMYRWLRAGRCDWRAALLGAIAFEFSAYLVAHRSHLTIHHAVAWLPWIFYGWCRFAQTGRYRHFALATVVFGLHLLVQHVQVSVIIGSLLIAYVAVILWPQRRSLWWQFPVGTGIGAMMAAVQFLPTWFQFAGSTRETPAYHVFIENSWVPTSALMFLFPMFYGTGTPNLWDQPWWGISHFCEQWPYSTILILLLAGASVAWVGRNREITFWWIACLCTLLIALGDLTPISKLLYHIPIYRNLRVPARWILIGSVAMPVLSAAVVSVLLKGGEEAERVGRCVRFMATRALPLAAAACVLLMIVARWQIDWLERSFGHCWNADHILGGLRVAVRPGNPTIWVPLVLMAATAWLLVCWTRTRRPRLFVILFTVFLVDVASVVAFVDVDTRFYRVADLTEPPPLAEAIERLGPRPGDRLLVPRYFASAHRPIELLFPQTNMLNNVATFQGYGPLWPVAHRLLFRFAPWGSSEAVVSLLRNTPLMQAMGIRFLAVRSEEERRNLSTSMIPPLVRADVESIPEAARIVPVDSGEGLLWPVRVDTPGLYELTLRAEPMIGSPSRWFVGLETEIAEPIGHSQSIDPVDLSMGPRKLRFLFACERASGPAYIRVKSERGRALSAGRATFGRIAGPSSVGEGGDAPFVHRADLPRNPMSYQSADISLYELLGTRELVYWARRVETVPDLLSAVERLTAPSSRPSPSSPVSPPPVVVEWPADDNPVPSGGVGKITYDRPAGHELRIQADDSAGGILVFNESFDAGWEASIDGRRAEILRVNAVCQAVAVPLGPHEVRFRYRPRGLVAGMACSGLSILVLAIGYLATRRTQAA